MGTSLNFVDLLDGLFIKSRYTDPIDSISWEGYYSTCQDDLNSPVDPIRVILTKGSPFFSS